MNRIMTVALLTVVAMILVSCNASSDKPSPTPAQGTASSPGTAPSRIQETAAAATPAQEAASSPSTSQQPGKMYYTVSGSTVTVHNTPGGTMKGEMNFPTGASVGVSPFTLLIAGER